MRSLGACLALDWCCQRTLVCTCSSKGRTLPRVPKDVSELPDWNFDGSSTKQVRQLCERGWPLLVRPMDGFAG
jgi:hypothetical protein